MTDDTRIQTYGEVFPQVLGTLLASKAVSLTADGDFDYDKAVRELQTFGLLVPAADGAGTDARERRLGERGLPRGVNERRGKHRQRAGYTGIAGRGAGALQFREQRRKLVPLQRH